MRDVCKSCRTIVRRLNTRIIFEVFLPDGSYHYPCGGTINFCAINLESDAAVDDPGMQKIRIQQLLYEFSMVDLLSATSSSNSGAANAEANIAYSRVACGVACGEQLSR
jgi:hypothetical protein